MPVIESSLQPRRRDQHLLDRAVVRRTRPVAKALLAALAWANSGVTMVLCIMWLETQLTAAPATWISYVVGLLLTILLTIAQVYTKDAHIGGYAVALLPDVATTSVQHARWTIDVGIILFGPVIGFYGGAAAALLIGWYSARLPERLIFGQS